MPYHSLKVNFTRSSLVDDHVCVRWVFLNILKSKYESSRCQHHLIVPRQLLLCRRQHLLIEPRQLLSTWYPHLYGAAMWNWGIENPGEALSLLAIGSFPHAFGWVGV